MNRAEDARFTTIRLHRLRDDSWAVIGLPSGAIASDERGELLMRLPEVAARRIAAELSAARADKRDDDQQRTGRRA